MRTQDLITLAQECQYAYDTSSECVRWGCDLATVGERDGNTIVAFRGTADTTGWLNNAHARPMTFPAAGWRVPVHGGFAGAVLDGAVRLLDRIDRDKPIIATGHSRGGAMALLFAHLARCQGYSVQEVVTFGEPRSIVGAFENPIPHTRVVNGHDPVPHIPRGLGYMHDGEQIWLNRAGWLGSIVSRAWMGAGLFAADSIRDHLLDAYIASLEKENA